MRIIGPNGRPLWNSGDRYGGTNNYYETKKKKDIAFRGDEAPPWRVYISNRVLIRDLDGDGLNEVIVCKNQRSTLGFTDRLRTFEKGEICDLVWDEGDLLLNWKTREITGYITDYQVMDVDNDGEEELVVSVVNPSSIAALKSTSNVLFFKLF